MTVVAVAVGSLAAIVKCPPEHIPELLLAFAAVRPGGGPRSVRLGGERNWDEVAGTTAFSLFARSALGELRERGGATIRAEAAALAEQIGLPADPRGQGASGAMASEVMAAMSMTGSKPCSRSVCRVRCVAVDGNALHPAREYRSMAHRSLSRRSSMAGACSSSQLKAIVPTVLLVAGLAACSSPSPGNSFSHGGGVVASAPVAEPTVAAPSDSSVASVASGGPIKMQTQDGYSYNVTFVIKSINPAPIDTVDSSPGKATSDIYSPDTQIFVENTTPGRNASSVEVTVGGLYGASRPACEIFRADSRLGHEITVEGKKYCVLLFSQTTSDAVQKMSPTERQEFDGNDINGEKQDFDEGRVPVIIADTVKGADRYFVTGIPNSSGPACKIHYSFDFTGGFGGDAIAISPAYKPFSCTPAT